VTAPLRLCVHRWPTGQRAGIGDLDASDVTEVEAAIGDRSALRRARRPSEPLSGSGGARRALASTILRGNREDLASAS
jgi:hypothetical protein